MPERGSKTSTVPVVSAKFRIFSARSKWFPVERDWWQWKKPGYITMTHPETKHTINGLGWVNPEFGRCYFENLSLYEIRWKYIVDQSRPQITIWRMRIACWIPKATNTLSGYCFSTAKVVAPTRINITL